MSLSSTFECQILLIVRGPMITQIYHYIIVTNVIF